MTEDVAESVRTLAASARTLAGRYEIGELIGRGGMSDVYAGTDTRLGRKVAIKLLRANLAEDPQFRARFRREAQDAAKMAHPTIVRIFDAGEEAVPSAEGGERLVPFIVMEHIDGRLLSDVLREGPMEPKAAARVLEQVLIALEYSHRAGVIHRDIKPSNIMITRNGQVKVMDFGIARAVSESAATLAETSKVVGTAQYFSPEQARGEQVDARTDLYSTGVVLFEALTGRALFDGDNPVAIAYQHLNAEPPIPSSIRPSLTPALDAVVLKSLAKQPSLRYQSAAEFRADLAAAVNGQLDIRRSSVTRPDAFAATLFGSEAGAAAAAQRRLTTEVDDRSTRTQSGPPVLWIWTGVVVLLAIVAAVIYWIATLQPANLTAGLTVELPAIAGQPYDQAKNQLENSGLTVTKIDQASGTIQSGSVIDYSGHSAGEKVEKGSQIDVLVSTGAESVAVPDVTRMDQATASAALQGQGFVVGQITTSTSATVPSGAVADYSYGGLAHSAAGGLTAPRGATIDLVISNGLVTVPDLTGHAISDAQAQFTSLGLTIDQTNIDSSCGGLILKKQSLIGDVPQGSGITITVCGQ